MSRFSGKTFLITGGTSGIGRATAEQLLAEGARVMVTGTNEQRLADVKNTLAGVIAIKNDAADPAATQELAEAVKAEVGKIDGAFLNAGFGRFQPLDSVTAEEFDAQYAVNVRAPLLQTSALAPLLNDGGAVVLNTSVAQNMGMAASAIYSSTKGAVRTLTRTLARELAPRQIRVNAVSPGPIGTDFLGRTGMPEEAINQFAETILSQVPLGRFGTSAEVAAVALFLLSDDASFVTGSEYVVDGGISEL